MRRVGDAAVAHVDVAGAFLEGGEPGHVVAVDVCRVGEVAALESLLLRLEVLADELDLGGVIGVVVVPR